MASKANNAIKIEEDSGIRNIVLLDEDNFKQLFHENYAALCKYCIQFVRRPEIAEEIVQEQFIYIWKNKNKLVIHTSYQSYLYKAVKNKSIDHLRSRFTQVELKDDDELVYHSAWENPSANLEADELKRLVGEAVLGLPEKCHTVFTLSRFGEMKNKEIAETLNISIKTVENQITIALKKIKTFLEKHWMLLMLLFSLILKEK